jgi:hypothetical protein
MLTAKRFTDAIAKRLKMARQIDIRYCEGLTPTPEAEQEKLAALLKAYLGPPPSEKMRRRLSFPRHVKLYWEYEVGKDLFTGEISLNNLGVALLEKDFSSIINYAEQPELAFLDVYRILEDRPYGGDGYMTLIGLNDAFTDVDLYYFYRGKPHRLRLSFEDYLRCLMVTLGYSHWQFLFCEGLDPQMRDHMQNTYRPKLVKDINTIWPGTDLSGFFALVDRA